jgi:hypothetical protein
VPLPWLLLHLPATAVNGVLTGARSGHPGASLRGAIAGVREGCARWRERRPVSPRAYRLHRRLKKGGPALLEALTLPLPAARA